jgi:hypothetical protein
MQRAFNAGLIADLPAIADHRSNGSWSLARYPHPRANVHVNLKPDARVGTGDYGLASHRSIVYAMGISLMIFCSCIIARCAALIMVAQSERQRWLPSTAYQLTKTPARSWRRKLLRAFIQVKKPIERKALVRRNCVRRVQAKVYLRAGTAKG